MERDKNSIGSVVKSFDIFRKLPSDVTSGTQSGAISKSVLYKVSIFSAFLLLFLFISEIREFRKENIQSEMFILGKSVETPVI
jgi:hypothetical protein